MQQVPEPAPQQRQVREQEEAVEAALPGLVPLEASRGQHSNSPALEQARARGTPALVWPQARGTSAQVRPRARRKPARDTSAQARNMPAQARGTSARAQDMLARARAKAPKEPLDRSALWPPSE